MRLVFEGLTERNYVLNNVDYMTRPIKIILPVKNMFSVAWYYAGLWVYQGIFAFASKKKELYPFSAPWIMGKKAMKEQFPLLDKKLKYGVGFEDG